MSKPKNQENLCNVPKENWREVIKTNQNLPTKPVIVQDANEQEKVFNELKNKRFIYRWVKKNNTNKAYVSSSETKERRRPFFHLKRAGKSHSLGTNKILQRNIRKYGRDQFVLVIFETFNPLCEQTTKKEFRDFVQQKEDFYLNFFSGVL